MKHLYQLTLAQFLECQQTRKLSRQFLEMVVDLGGLRQTTTATFKVLDKPRYQFELGLTLRASKLVVIVGRRV